MVDSRKSGVGSDDVYQSNLWYFDEMNFLQDQETPTTSRSTLDARPSRYESTDNCNNNSDNTICDKTLVNIYF